jgi:nitronate monooxygenase
MFKTRITEMLGIEYPIIQGGMLWLSTAELVAAVSNAGGLGILTALSFENKERLREEIQKVKSLTKKPFAVNVSMLPTIVAGEKTEEYFEVIIEEGVKVVETAGRNPEPYLPPLKKAGIKVIHKVPAVRFAQKAEEIGVDAVTIVGYECAGHPGMDDVTTLILIPKATSILKIPVIAAGGIGDARGFMAALCLGAEGVLMGTRFLLTHECWAHPNIKKRLLEASERDTMIIERSIKNAARVLKNDAAMKALAMEEKGATLEELLTVISGQLGKKAFVEGDWNVGTIACGQVVGLINELKTVKEVIEEIVEGAKIIQKRLKGIIGS